MSTVDILPTVLRQAGLAIPQTDGVDLLQDATRPARVIPLESMMGARSFGLSTVVGLREQGWLWESSPADHLWDLRADPEEQHELAKTRPDLLAKLRARRSEFGIPDLAEPLVQDAETLAQLRALGHVNSVNQATTGDVREFTQEGLDWFNAVVTHLHHGDYAQAEHFARKWQDRPDEAETEYRRLLAMDPADFYALNNLSRPLVRAGRMDEALPFLRSFVELYPRHDQTREVQSLLDDWSKRRPEEGQEP